MLKSEGWVMGELFYKDIQGNVQANGYEAKRGQRCGQRSNLTNIEANGYSRCYGVAWWHNIPPNAQRIKIYLLKTDIFGFWCYNM